ncbi:MAG: ABC transporter ATP-binding protein [Bacillota bacterium]
MIKVEHVSKSYGSLPVLADFSLEIPEGKITAILGPSGCGKTTLLNILAGLIRVDRGNVEIPVNTSYLFQEPRLLPWLTVKQNIAFVLKDKLTPEEIAERIDTNLKATGLTGFADAYPSELSGGMRQRAAMARAFSYEAPLLLMDEPFKSLDIKTRFQLVQDFLGLWQKRLQTVIMVTHDIREALWLAERIVVFSDKPVRILQDIALDIPPEKRGNNERLGEIERKFMEQYL